jgi:hypothetical protein
MEDTVSTSGGRLINYNFLFTDDFVHVKNVTMKSKNSPISKWKLSGNKQIIQYTLIIYKNDVLSNLSKKSKRTLKRDNHFEKGTITS